MDIDAEEEYSLIDNFDCSSEGFPWSPAVVQTIEARRVLMTDVLIFDILLSLGGIKHPDTLYPPRTPEVLQQLLDAIEDSAYDTLKKDGLIYFLLRWHRDERAGYYAQARCIPPQFVALADAYWYLDAGEDLYRAVSLLADARLNRDYTSKIIQALSHDADAPNLILRYVRTAKPLLLEPDDIDAYSIALAESSLLDAWQYQRTYSEGSATRARLIRNILTWALTPKPRSKPLTQLIAYPLTPYEETQLHTYAIRPPNDLPPASIPVIQDLACVRLIQGGQYAAAVKLDRQFSLNSVRGKMTEQARRATQARKQLIDEIMATLTVAERSVVEAELEKIAPSPGGDAVIIVNDNAGDLSMSWEAVRYPNSPAKPSGTSGKDKQNDETPKAPPPPTPQSVLQSPIPPIPHRSGAPRFGASSPAAAVASPPSSSFAAVREMFDNMSKQAASPQQPPQDRQALSAKTTDPELDARNAPSTGVPRGPSYRGQAQSASAGPSSSSAGKRKAPGTIYGDAGSANRTGNAFYSPVSAGVKRPLEDAASPARRSPPPPGLSRSAHRNADMSTASAADVSGILGEVIPEEEPEREEDAQEPEEEDVEMHEAEFTLPHIEPEDIAAATEARAKKDLSDVDPGELSFSLFTPTADSGTPQKSAYKAQSAVSPPGAFLPAESEDEHEFKHELDLHEDERQEDAPAQGDMHIDELTTPPRRRAARESRIPRPQQAQTQAQQQQPTRTTRTRSAQVEAKLKQSIPGAFMDENDEEDADVVPPLPASTSTATTASAASVSRRAPRKTRTKEEAKTPSRPTRRSSRLSHMSTESSSEEPVSPERERVVRKRASTRTAGASHTTSTAHATATRSARTKKHR